MNLRRLLLRSLTYFKTGSVIVNIPFGLIGVTSSFYTLIKVIQWDKMLIWFPTFEKFIFLSIPIYFIGTGVFGYLYLKSPFYTSGARDVSILRDPIGAGKRYSPIGTLSMMMQLDHYKREGADPVLIRKIEVIVERSIEYWRDRGVTIFD